MDRSDQWFVRLPDGRVVVARSTQSVRFHLQSGRIPPGSRLRRGPSEPWSAPEILPEFGEAAAPVVPIPEKPPRSRNGGEMKTTGVRGLMEELFGALDAALARFKVAMAGLAGLVAGMGTTATILSAGALPFPWNLGMGIGLGSTFVGMLCLVGALLTRVTFIELSRLRPPRPREIMGGLLRDAVRWTVTVLLVGGTVGAILWSLDRLPAWLAQNGSPAFLDPPLWVCRLLLEVLCWPVLALIFLAGPVLVVEECGILKGLVQWWSLLRLHLSKVLIYQALAFALAAVISLPFLTPVFLAGLRNAAAGPGQEVVRALTLAGLGGLALAPSLAFIFTANVYVYLNLKYEFSISGRRGVNERTPT